ncbi:hypothetical protein [Arthrobacter sp. M4]|uniref:hypothetical protein n=1 Tax=Arthrobacter sp. M4 TaxID=218160 RepID=UPI001CDCC0C9|nr:hypothetical protein [Arthrobacter sp. M4]MCA4132025.1 hypothetical protein [Arthrobacter sp. M4]
MSTATHRSTATDAERFWEKVDKEAGRLDGTGCWVWTASGRFGLSNGRSSVTPRRYAWEALQQELGLGSLTQDEILRMACGRSACVNPGHMQKGAKPLRRPGSRTCARGHTMDADNGYWAKDGTWVCRPCKRDHSRRYRQDPQFRADQAAASARYIAADPQRAERKKQRQRQRYRDDPDYRARIRAAARERRARKKAEEGRDDRPGNVDTKETGRRSHDLK